jgi:hypothetical protein
MEAVSQKRMLQLVARRQFCKQSNTHTRKQQYGGSVFYVVRVASRLLLLGNGAANFPSQQYVRRGVFYMVRAESI